MLKCWNAPLINENFLSFSQLQDEYAWCASRNWNS